MALTATLVLTSQRNGVLMLEDTIADVQSTQELMNVHFPTDIPFGDYILQKVQFSSVVGTTAPSIDAGYCIKLLLLGKDSEVVDIALAQIAYQPLEDQASNLKGSWFSLFTFPFQQPLRIQAADGDTLAAVLPEADSAGPTGNYLVRAWIRSI